MIKCELCGKPTVVKVAEQHGLDMFSCCNEECIDYAELLVETNGGLESVHTMLDGFKQIVKEVTDEKNKVRKGRS